MIVKTNVLALNSLTALRRVETGQGATLKKLASGKRVNTAADDAVATAMRENKQALIRGSEQALRNAQDGISLTQTAQGGIDTIQGMVHRMRELCVEAANDTFNSEDRKKIAIEIDHLNEQITKTAEQTTFNGRNVLAIDDISGEGLKIHISSQPSVQVIVERTNITASSLGTLAVDVSNSASANNSLKIIDDAVNRIADEQTRYGAYQQRFDEVIANLNITTENANASCAIITDANMATESIKLAKYNILMASTDIMLANANQNPKTVLTLLKGE